MSEKIGFIGLGLAGSADGLPICRKPGIRWWSITAPRRKPKPWSQKSRTGRASG